MNQQTHLKVGVSLNGKGIFRRHPTPHLFPTLLLSTFEQCLYHFLFPEEATPEFRCTEGLASGLFPPTLHLPLLPPESPHQWCLWPPCSPLHGLASPLAPLLFAWGSCSSLLAGLPGFGLAPLVAIAGPLFPPHNTGTISHFCRQCVSSRRSALAPTRGGVGPFTFGLSGERVNATFFKARRWLRMALGRTARTQRQP